MISGLVGHTRNAEEDFVNEWVDARRHVVSFVASVMRNEGSEAGYLSSLQAPGRDATLPPIKVAFSIFASRALLKNVKYF